MVNVMLAIQHVKEVVLVLLIHNAVIRVAIPAQPQQLAHLVPIAIIYQVVRLHANHVIQPLFPARF